MAMSQRPPRKYKRRYLTLSDGVVLPSSVPLMIPDNVRYDQETNKLTKRHRGSRDKLVVTDIGRRLLQSIKEKPVAVLSICGPYRTGKSYILSRTIGDTRAFELGHEMEACTIGIWMGTTVLECDDFVVVMLDTEGICATSAKASDDTKILVMTVLLSSLFIYNSTRIPESRDLETMACFTHLSRSILVRDGFHSEEAFVEFRDFFPDFLWLLRDVMLRIPNGATPTAYLKERVLTASGSKPPTAADNVAIAIHTFFPSIECWMLPPPSDDPDVMEDIENKENELSPYFKRKLAKLIHYIRQTIKAKTGLSSDQQVDGKMLASLMDHLVEAVNDPDTIPNLDNTWQHVITKKANEIIQAMVAEYEEDLQTILSPLLPLDEEYQDEFGKEHKNLPTLMGVHRSVLESKIVKLDKTLSGLVPHGTTIGKRSAHNMREEFCDKFIYQVVQCESERVHHTFSEQKVYVTGGILFKFTQKNKKRSHEYCMQLFRELYKPIDKQLSSWNPLYTFEHLQDDLCEAREKYFDKAVGPAKWDIYHRECEQFAHQRRAQLRNLQGFNHTILETMRKENEARTVNAKLHSDMQQMQTQIDNQRKREEERYQRRIEEVEEAKRRFRREEEQKRVALQNRYKELVRARMDEAARAQQRKIQEMKRIYVRREEQLHRERREAERRREGVTASWAQAGRALKKAVVETATAPARKCVLQ